MIPERTKMTVSATLRVYFQNLLLWRGIVNFWRNIFLIIDLSYCFKSEISFRFYFGFSGGRHVDSHGYNRDYGGDIKSEVEILRDKITQVAEHESEIDDENFVVVDFSDPEIADHAKNDTVDSSPDDFFEKESYKSCDGSLLAAEEEWAEIEENKADSVIHDTFSLNKVGESFLDSISSENFDDLDGISLGEQWAEHESWAECKKFITVADNIFDQYDWENVA